MSETQNPPIKLLQKDVIARELSPIYACTTIKHGDPDISQIYRGAINEIISKRRPTTFSYYDGAAIHGTDLLESEKIAVLKRVAKQFQSKKLAFSSCYADILGKDIVNLGLYFQNDAELKKFAEVYGADLRFSFVADLQSNGIYTFRGEKGQCSGHFTNSPHLKSDMQIRSEGKRPTQNS